MKHLSIALIALGLSVPALANDAVCVPSQKGGFKIAIDPLYLRSTPGVNISDSNFDWGFFAQIGYLFPATGNDLTVNYTYLRSGENASLDLDDVNLELGQRLTTAAFDVRLFSGVGYGHLNYAADMSTPTNRQSVTGLFHGFGPRMGLDARYQLGNCSCFGLDTHLNTSLLVGTITTRSQNQFGAAISDSMNGIVPEVNAKLGIDYTVPSSNKSAFGVEVGYQTNNYLNAFNGSLMNGVNNANFDGVYVDIRYYS
jgi:hypothetical protein